MTLENKIKKCEIISQNIRLLNAKQKDIIRNNYKDKFMMLLKNSIDLAMFYNQLFLITTQPTNENNI